MSGVLNEITTTEGSGLKDSSWELSDLFQMVCRFISLLITMLDHYRETKNEKLGTVEHLLCDAFEKFAELASELCSSGDSAVIDEIQPVLRYYAGASWNIW